MRLPTLGVQNRAPPFAHVHAHAHAHAYVRPSATGEVLRPMIFAKDVELLSGQEFGPLVTAGQFLDRLIIRICRSRVHEGKDWRIHDCLRMNSSLVSMQMNACALEPNDAILIGEGLLDNSTLRVLDLNSNNIEDEGFEAIAKSLRMPPDSQSAWSHLIDTRDEMEDIKKDYVVVQKEYTGYLKLLKMENGIMKQPDGTEGFMFRDPRARIKFDEIRKKMNNFLMEMEVAGLRMAEAKEYYEKLKGNCHLTELDCGSNYLLEASGFEMASTLLWNTSLVTLKLGGNSIGEEGIMAMATALGNHVSLTKLDLSGNIFGAEAGKALARMLVTNTRLTGMTQTLPAFLPDQTRNACRCCGWVRFRATPAPAGDTCIAPFRSP